MDRDLEALDDSAVAVGRDGIRDQFRYRTRESHPDGRPHLSPLEIERGRHLTRALGAVASPAHAMQMVIELAVFEPWATTALSEQRRGRVNPDVREEALESACELLPGPLPPLSRIRHQLFGDPRYKTAKLVALAGVGIGVGVATAGVAAPAIGTAVGGAMGLSGAAAASAGLAWLGGGALAGGGFGMAGGTVLLSALGGLGGGGLASLAASRAARPQFAIETRKLRTLIRLCATSPDPATTRVGLEQQLVLEGSVRDLLGQRIKQLGDGSADTASVDREIQQTVKLRRQVGTIDFPIEPC